MHIFILPQWKQHLWKSKECFWKSRSCPIRSPRSFKQFSTLRDLLSTRFRPLDGILRAISSRKIRGEKRSRKWSNWVNCSRQDSSSSSSSSREREREKGSKHGRDVFRKTNEISFHERGRHRRKGMLLCVVTCEQSLSSMYIRALMEFAVWENARACHD